MSRKAPRSSPSRAPWKCQRARASSIPVNRVEHAHRGAERLGVIVTSADARVGISQTPPAPFRTCPHSTLAPDRLAKKVSDATQALIERSVPPQLMMAAFKPKTAFGVISHQPVWASTFTAITIPTSRKAGRKIGAAHERPNGGKRLQSQILHEGDQVEGRGYRRQGLGLPSRGRSAHRTARNLGTT